MKMLKRDKFVKASLLIFFSFVFGVFTRTALADATGQGAIVRSSCMQDIAGFELGCTANDVRVSGVADVAGPSGPGPDGVVDEFDIQFALVCDATAANSGTDCSGDVNICLDKDGAAAPQFCGDKCAFPGDTTTFSATFIFELNAQQRFDVGAYFEVTPDSLDDGALTGSCDIITLPEDETEFARPDGSIGNYVDLDTNCKGGKCPQPEDLCGDINDENNPIFYDMKGSKNTSDMITAVCIDPDNDGKLNLPNCTSWRQSGANEMCEDGGQAFPGSPSKCNCDPNFQVPIYVPAATITVVKTAVPLTVNEPGGYVKFSVSVTNNSLFAFLNTDTLEDSVYGDSTLALGDITSTNCKKGIKLEHGETYSCYFIAEVKGNGDTIHKNTLTIKATDQNSNILEDSDDATVSIIDVMPKMTVSKTCVAPCYRVEPGGEFGFTAKVINTSLAESLNLTSMIDDMYGDITSTAMTIKKTDCTLPQSIDIGGYYECTFYVNEIHQPPWNQTDIIKFIASDNEGNELKQTASAMIHITNDEAKIEVFKSVSSSAVNEPGGEITFTFIVENLSLVDTLFLNTLTDDILGNLDNNKYSQGVSTCDVEEPVEFPLALILPPGGTYECTATYTISGDAGDFETNTVTAKALDDDYPQNEVTDSDTVTVDIIDVKPKASLTKTPKFMIVSYEVIVTNDSKAESLVLTKLDDDEFGDVTFTHDKVLSTTCSVPQVIGIGENYTCKFEGEVTTSPHTNKVTGTVIDNEDNPAKPAPADSATVTFESLN